MSTPTVILSQDQNSLNGLNFKYSTTNLAQVVEVTLVYFKNTSDANIQTIDLTTGTMNFNIDMGLDSGSSYSFQLQIRDINNLIAYSNLLVLTAPLSLSVPVISSATANNNSIDILLDSSGNLLSSTDTVEFLLKKTDNTFFWIIKPFSSTGSYTLTNTDNSLLVNYSTYRLACIYQPSSSNTYYTSPSSVSSSVSVTPTDLPNIATNLLLSSVGTSTLDLSLTWSRPSNFSQWSSSAFSISLALFKDGINVVYLSQVLTTDVTSFVFSNVQAGSSYTFTVIYTNTIGGGLVSATSNSITPACRPDAPVLQLVSAGDQFATVVFTPPVYDGQSTITSYKVYRDGLFLQSSTSTSVLVSSLVNGVSYSFTVSAVNAIGDSVLSNAISVVPFGLLSIQSVAVLGKTVTVTIVPNGLPVQEVFMFAIDSPQSTDQSKFLIIVPQNQISQNTTGTIQVVQTFSLTNNISKYYVRAYNASNNAFATTF